MFEINNYSWIGLKGGMSQTVLMRLWAIMIIEEREKFVRYVLHEVWDIGMTSITGSFLVPRVSFVIFSGIVALVCVL